MVTWILLGLIVLIAIYVIIIYNRLVKNRQMVREGWSGIDVQLKRRANLIPNLVETVKGYMDHERDTLSAVTEMRAKAQGVGGDDVAGRARAEGALGMALGKLFAVAENYPDLKASENFQDLQESLDKVEHELQMARRYYNGTVRNLNTLVEAFPSNIVAGQFKFRPADYFEIENAEDRAVPEVKF